MTTPDLLPDPPARRLSPLRVVVALLLLAVAAGGALGLLRHAATDRTAKAATASRLGPWFAPYVDATLTPSVAFQDRSANPSRDVVLGFVVAGDERRRACTPTWGTFATLGGAATAYDLDRRIAQVRGQGGRAIVSFGGQANAELAVACHRPDALAAAYRSVVDRYHGDTVDFDIEGTAVADADANARRTAAVKVLQSERHHLAVWLTLPVSPRGLTPDGLALIRTMTAAKVELAGVNIMAMDFGEPQAGQDMRQAVLSSITASRTQLATIFGAGRSWSRLGVTIMIGQNDLDAERLSLADAKAIGRFARAHGVARLSLWSLNRDAQCGATFAVLHVHSDSCSGVAQKPLAFSRLLAGIVRGSAQTASAAAPTGALPVPSVDATADDPARSPYPIWAPEQAYRAGYKVVWHHAVYVAQWYSQGVTPGVAAASMPWRMVGPVLTTDRAPSLRRLPAGTYPAWTVTRVFRAGDRVLFHRLPYQAGWYTQGDRPGGPAANGQPSPWKALYAIPGEPKTG